MLNLGIIWNNHKENNSYFYKFSLGYKFQIQDENASLWSFDNSIFRHVSTNDKYLTRKIILALIQSSLIFSL